MSIKIKDLCSSLSLKQLIEEPTRITPHSSTLLDLILTNSVNVSKSGVLYSGISDQGLFQAQFWYRIPVLKTESLIEL